MPSIWGPVVIPRKALYGDPESWGGGHWERHLEKIRKGKGCETIYNWPSLFWHPKLQLLLLVCVDGFKLAGHEENLGRGWELISKLVDMSSPKLVDKLLGCIHRESTAILDGRTVLTIEYDMSAFMPIASTCTANVSRLYNPARKF